MKLGDYLKDKVIEIFVIIIVIMLVQGTLVLFNSNYVLISLIMIILIGTFIFLFLYDYLKKKFFYDNFKKTFDSLDQKYLITDIVNFSTFYEGNILLDSLYDIDKSMHEYLNVYKNTDTEFREYLEMWCHEIKTPIATAKLVLANNKSSVSLSIEEELEKIDYYIEQVLFYSRSDNVEKDYIIKKTNLKTVVEDVVKRNKKDLISKNIKIEISKMATVDTDSKWIEFILNQIVVNSIKYSKDKDAFIKFECTGNKNNAILKIIDNGIGIRTEDLPKVFEKGFTGINGRSKFNSTGIGLYLCKKLCGKLDCDISISSKVGEGTTVSLVFSNSSMISEII